MKKAKYVDPIIGTVGDEQGESSHGGGKTHPGACVPGGMVQLSPDTVTGGDNGTGYNYCQSTIEGFSFNHMSGIGWYGDLGNLQIMPVVGDTDLRSGSNEEVTFTKGTEGWKSAFSHEEEKAEAGYYSVKLQRYNVLAEATVSPHMGMLRFTYPEKSDARVIFNFSRRIGGKADFEKIEIVNDHRLEGTIICTPKGGGFGRGHGNISYNLSFVCEFSHPAEKMQFFSNEELKSPDLTYFEHEDTGLVAHFGSEFKEPLKIKCSIAYTDLDGAKNNFTEFEGFDFDKMRSEANDAWEKVFDCVDIEGSDETDMKIFHTCLYHTLLDPRISADVDGRFALNDQIIKADSYTHRTVFSGWDVYRSEFPLLSLIRPDVVRDEVCSLLKIAEVNNSSFPRWELMNINAGCMVGDPGLIVIADAYIKGIKSYDDNLSYEIAKASSLSKKELFGKSFHSIRPDCEQYTKDAFVPKKISDTLEYLLADYTMSRFAKAMGKQKDAEHFESRAKRYKENFKPVLRFMAPRKENGKFMFIYGKYDDNCCVESNIYQQSWFVPYDVKGLSRLMGEKRTIRLLEKFFKKAKFDKLWSNDYNHSNEPCHNITHYFSLLGLPHRTQYWTRRVQKEAYRTGAFGFCGNEDVGQLSAWYVLSALGFAQVCPGYDAYFLNTPLFKKATVKLNKDFHSCCVADTLTIECDKDPLEYPYIRRVYFNGQKIKTAYLTYEALTEGGTLTFELIKEPYEKALKWVPENFYN
ncbi:MAG: GH92 family glycosyl hydrolase [Clostridia bacterium]|nr:GH92 family glycosyl hydrolase [Clostridia bacterium]